MSRSKKWAPHWHFVRKWKFDFLFNFWDIRCFCDSFNHDAVSLLCRTSVTSLKTLFAVCQVNKFTLRTWRVFFKLYLRPPVLSSNSWTIGIFRSSILNNRGLWTFFERTLKYSWPSKVIRMGVLKFGQCTTKLDMPTAHSSLYLITSSVRSSFLVKVSIY